MQKSLTKNIEGYDKIEIPFDKEHLFVLFIIIFSFLILYIGSILPNFKEPISVFSWHFFYSIIYFLGTIYLYYIEFSLLRLIFYNKPGLIISDDGIIDYSTMFRIGLIDWGDIVHIEERGIFIAITVTDPELYISRQTNFFKRSLLLMSYDEDYDDDITPFYISPKSLDVSQADLLALIKNRWEIYLANKNI